MSSIVEWPRPNPIRSNTVCGYCSRRRLPVEHSSAEDGWAYIYPVPEDRTTGKLACPDCAPAQRAALIESGRVLPAGWERAAVEQERKG